LHLASFIDAAGVNLYLDLLATLTIIFQHLAELVPLTIIQFVLFLLTFLLSLKASLNSLPASLLFLVLVVLVLFLLVLLFNVLKELQAIEVFLEIKHIFGFFLDNPDAELLQQEPLAVLDLENVLALVGLFADDIVDGGRSLELDVVLVDVDVHPLW